MRKDNDYTMYRYLLNRDNHDNRVLVRYYHTDITANVLFAEFDKIADMLSSLGLTHSDNIALCLPNIPNAITTFYGANKVGIAVNLIHPLVPSEALADMVREQNSKVLFLFDLFYDKHKDVIKELNIPCVLCSASDYLYGIERLGYNIATASQTKGIAYGGNILRYSDMITSDYPQAEEYADIEGVGEHIAAYIHSGGTTGEPKTAILSNRAVNECAFNVASVMATKIEVGESMLMVLPLFHIFGLGVCMHTTLTAGARCLVVPKFSPKSVAKLIRREKATYLAGVPSMYAKLLKEKAFRGKHLANMKCAYSGGDKLDSEIKESFDRIMVEYGSSCRLCEGYGLTEAGICNVNVTEDCMTGSVGKPIGNAKVCVVDKENNKLKALERGEICIGGDSIMSGYYEDLDATNRVMFEDSEGISWVKTGDYGYLTESGHLYYVDRLKRMIKVSGINVFPAEIERIVTDNIIAVDKCCAIEMKYKGKSAVKLVFTLKDGYSDSEQLHDEICDILARLLMKYSLPREIKCVDKLPMTQIGKVDYKKLTIEEKFNEN